MSSPETTGLCPQPVLRCMHARYLQATGLGGQLSQVIGFIGTGSKRYGLRGRLVYGMYVDELLNRPGFPGDSNS